MTRVTRTAPLAVLVVLGVAAALPLTARAGDGVVPAYDRPRGNKYEARIDEMIGAQIPLDIALRDENDDPINLKTCIDGKPTIFVPVYYRCPMLCTEVLNGLLTALREMPSDYSVGKDFNVVTVSMDSKEHGGPEADNLVQKKKAAYVSQYGRPGAESGWRFLTGTKDALAVVLDAVGYRFQFDKMLKEYNHPSALVILSPQGKVTRYFYDIDFAKEVRLDVPEVRNADGEMVVPTTTLRLSLIEAADGKGGSLRDRFTLLCYRYDRLHQGYSLNVLRVVQLGGVLTLLALGTGVFFALRRDRRGRPAPPAGPTDAQPSGGTA